MVRVELWGAPEDAQDFLGHLEGEGFRRQDMACIARSSNHPPNDQWPFFEERWHHPDGNVARFFPFVLIASGPMKGQFASLVVEFRPPSSPSHV